MIAELFSKSTAIGSHLIRAVEWGEWSHTCLFDTLTGLVVEATFPEGVRIIPFKKWVVDKTDFRMKQRRWPVEVWHTAATQVGKPYDWRGVLGIGLHRDWQSTDQWWCSELNEWAAMLHGVGTYDPTLMRRIGVQDRWKVA